MENEAEQQTPATEERIARELHIRGRVQGVFYRDSCRREATRLGITGYAYNLPDGSVEVRAEGRKRDVEDLISWCRQGPERARVDEVEIVEVALEHLTGFITG